jgi:hypothetical protein
MCCALFSSFFILLPSVSFVAIKREWKNIFQHTTTCARGMGPRGEMMQTMCTYCAFSTHCLCLVGHDERESAKEEATLKLYECCTSTCKNTTLDVSWRIGIYLPFHFRHCSHEKVSNSKTLSHTVHTKFRLRTSAKAKTLSVACALHT